MSQKNKNLTQEEFSEVISLLASRGFYKTKGITKVLEFNGEDLPFIYLLYANNKDSTVQNQLCIHPGFLPYINEIEGFDLNPGQKEIFSRHSNWSAFPKAIDSDGRQSRQHWSLRTFFSNTQQLEKILDSVISIYQNNKELADPNFSGPPASSRPNPSNDAKVSPGAEGSNSSCPNSDFLTEAKVAEGMPKAFFTWKYERSTALRKEALKRFGYKCSVCGFDFEETFGDIGKDFIEVHHIVPVSEGERVNDADNLRPLCSNCHRMIHKLYTKLEPEEYSDAIDILKSKIKK